jgi:hypothetical protein
MRTQRRAVIGWAIGLAAIATMYAAFYPSISQGATQLEGTCRTCRRRCAI